MIAIEFQALDWRSVDENGGHIVKIFGKTIKNETVCVEIDNCHPYFYIKIDDNDDIDGVIEEIKNRISIHKKDKKKLTREDYRAIRERDGYIDYEICQKCNFKGFTNYKKFNFAKISFSTLSSRYRYASEFFKYYKNKKSDYIFEANVDPFIRIMHECDLEAVGWIRIKNYININQKRTLCKYEILTEWKNLEKIENNTIIPLLIASFDIECTSEDGMFPRANRDNDKIIQIGTTFSRFGETECFEQHIFTLDTCDKMDEYNIKVTSCKTEEELLLKWRKMIIKMDPDIITGFNIIGFDMKYMYDRAKLLDINEEFSRLSRIKEEECRFLTKTLASSALGENKLQYYDISGRIIIDLLKVVMRDCKLESYKLDFVSSNFIKEKINEIECNKKTTIIKTNDTYGLKIDQYIVINYTDGISIDKFMDGKKFKVIELSKTEIVIEGILSKLESGLKYFWCQAKDDVSPRDIFKLQKGSSSDRAIIAKYCIKDCSLCNILMAKLQVLVNNIGMANVCSVPLRYIFMRGQSIKIYSLVLKKCMSKNHLIPSFESSSEEDNNKESEFDKFIQKLNRENDDDNDDDDTSYEGALVIPPTPGCYYDPIFVLDYSSLYPKSMIERNLSHECCVLDEKYLGLENYIYRTIEYQSKVVTEPYSEIKAKEVVDSIKQKQQWIIEKQKIPATTNSKVKLIKHYKVYEKERLIMELYIDTKEIKIINYEKSIFVENEDGSKGIIPEILINVLDARSFYKKEMEKEKNPFNKAVLDGRQLAYKVTANSIYGQCGSSISQISMKSIAASTTATGRERLAFSKKFIENDYSNLVNLALTNKSKYKKYCHDIFEKSKRIKKWVTLEKFIEEFYSVINEHLKGHSIEPKIIYGDTDSIFVRSNIRKNGSNEILIDRASRIMSIQLGIWASNCLFLKLPEPQEQVYEKVLHPFMILTKKKYVGNLYEKNPDKFYQKSMGIVLKRRDNAPIVKIVCGGIIDYLLNKKDPKGAMDYTEDWLKKILRNKIPFDKFTITKTLKEKYKDRTRIAHAVLADRIAERDPGNRPMPNDRIAYIYIINNSKTKLQGEKIETPEFIIENNLKVDYLFYITNQIKKPALQFLELINKDSEKIFDKYITLEQTKRSGKNINKYLSKDVIDENFMDQFDDELDDNCEKNLKKKNKKKPQTNSGISKNTATKKKNIKKIEIEMGSKIEF